MTLSRKPYPSDVGDEGWALDAPYLTLLPEEASQREHPLREVFNGLRTIVKTGAPWRWMPNDLPPWAAVYQQAQRWLQAGCFEELAHDLRAVPRLAAGRPEETSAAVIDSRTLRSTPRSGARAGHDGVKASDAPGLRFVAAGRIHVAAGLAARRHGNVRQNIGSACRLFATAASGPMLPLFGEPRR